MPTENIRTIVTESLIGMIATVAQKVPPANEPPPPFIQGPIDRAVDRIRTLVNPGVTLAAARANRVYLAGPITGIADFNYPTFNAMADRLRAAGYQVENPADHGTVEGAVWADYMASDLTRLGLCGLIALLPGWDLSQGARIEVMIAEHLGMRIVNVHDLVSMEIAG